MAGTQKRWYVFDQFDCFSSWDTAAEAAIEAEMFSKREHLQGIHIALLSLAQFHLYCMHGDLKRALEQAK